MEADVAQTKEAGGGAGLQSGPPEGTCNLCGGRDHVLLIPGNLGDRRPARFSQYAWFDDIYRCRGCGLVAQHRRHDIDEIINLLRSELYLDEAIGPLNIVEKDVQFATLIEVMREFGDLAGASVFDVGANTGVFLNCLRPLVGQVAGLEPSAEAASEARSRFGLDVRQGVIADIPLPSAAFDIITMWDVVEHLYDPKGDVARLCHSLRPGGRLFVSTHDIGSLLARISGRRYPMLMYQHFYHFTPATLGRLLTDAGLRVLGTRYFFKSWSCAYLFHLIEKKWPESPVAKRIEAALAPLVRIDGIGRRRLVMPMRDFFVMAAERP